MLALAHACNKHKVRAETVVPQLERAALRLSDDACRCGHVEGCGTAVIRQGDGVKQLDLTALCQALHLFARFGRVRGTRDVGQDATGTGERDCSFGKLVLQLGQLRHVGGRAVPPRLGAPTHRAHARAGGIDDDPIKGSERPGALSTAEAPTVTGDDLDGVEEPRRSFDKPGAVRVHFVGGHPSANFRRESGKHCRLPARARA